MKVLLVNTSDHTGGAAIAALRLLKALRQNGVDATLLCRDRTLPAERTEVVNLKPSLWLKVKFVMERAEIFAANGFTRKGLFAVDTAHYGTDITRLPEFEQADVIHLHWTNQGMLSLRQLERVLRSGKRIVWTMHDMWPFTGVCHHASECQRWKEECSHCPLLQRPSAHDLSSRVFHLKQKVYSQGHITFVGCSQWLTGLAAQSPLLEGHQVVHIPNPIDTSFYAPAPDKGEVRQRMGLPLDKRILLFTAFKVTDPNKGLHYLAESIELMRNTHPEMHASLALAVAGQGAESVAADFSIPVHAFAYDTSEERQRNLYQAADLLVMPTLMDNLPNTVMESMACGTPCVGFHVGGLPQMIDTGINGYLAEERNSADFAQGIVRMLSSASYDSLSRNARSKTIQAYSEKSVADKFIQIYEGKPAEG